MRNPQRAIRSNGFRVLRSLSVSASITGLYFLTVGFERIGVEMSPFRDLLGFTFLLFVPGFLLLRILRVCRLPLSEILLHVVGLSVVSISLLGALSSVLLPLVGIGNPLSYGPLAATAFGFVAFLSVLAYLRDSTNQLSLLPRLSSTELIGSLLLCVLPLIAVLGTVLMNRDGVSWMNMCAVVLVATVPLLAAFDRLPPRLYPLAIATGTLTLLFHTFLLTNYVWGWDIQFQYYTASRALNSAWDPSFPRPTNSLTTIVILSTSVATISGTSLDVVFKIVYPLLYALFPVTIYLATRTRLDRKLSLFSALVVAFYSQTYLRMAGKQHISQLFIGLFVVALLRDSIAPQKRRILLFVYLFGVVISHYSSSLLFGGILLVGTLSVIFVSERVTAADITEIRSVAFRPLLAFAYLGILSCWYLYTSNGVVFDGIFVYFPYEILSNFSDLLFAASERTGSHTVQTALLKSVIKQVHVVLHLCFQFLIAAGLLRELGAVARRHETEFSPILVALATPMFAFLVLAFFMEGHFGSDRAYDLGLVLLAPFGLVGYETLAKRLSDRLEGRWVTAKSTDNGATSRRIFSVFLVLFLIFNAGVVYHVSGTSYTLLAFQQDYDYPTFSDEEIAGVEWLSEHTSDGSLYADRYGEVALNRTHDHLSGRMNRFWPDTERIPPGSYIYFRSTNVDDEMLTHDSQTRHTALSDATFSRTVHMTNKVYTNGESNVYQSSRNNTVSE